MKLFVIRFLLFYAAFSILLFVDRGEEDVIISFIYAFLDGATIAMLAIAGLFVRDANKNE